MIGQGYLNATNISVVTGFDLVHTWHMPTMIVMDISLIDILQRHRNTYSIHTKNSNVLKVNGYVKIQGPKDRDITVKKHL